MLRLPTSGAARLAGCWLLVALAGCGGKRSADEVRVAGASNLVPVMEQIVPKFEAVSGKKVTFIPGSSGKLAAQLREGAPFDAFLSADAGFVDDVIAAGVCDASTRAIYARGRVVMWTPGGSSLQPPPDVQGLADPRYAKIAIANPDHAPYGAAARQALQATGVWAQVAPRVVYASNIKETMQFAETGNAEIALVALPLAVEAPGEYVEIPASLHAPIEQAMVACNGGKARDAGREFVAFVRTPEIRAILQSHGYEIPAP